MKTNTTQGIAFGKYSKALKFHLKHSIYVCIKLTLKTLLKIQLHNPILHELFELRILHDEEIKMSPSNS